MKTILRISDELYSSLIAHLQPTGSEIEQAAFLYATCSMNNGLVVFSVLETSYLAPVDFEFQATDYLELTNATRARVIKRAHDLNASLIELHSHPGAYPAAFSKSDLAGLKETVPNMFWRLKGAPYIAVVVSETGFDALTWIDDPTIPLPLDRIELDSFSLKPTNLTLKRIR